MCPQRIKLIATSREQLAAIFNVDRRTIARWLQQGAPARGPNGYDLKAWIHWWRLHKADAQLAIEAERRLKLARAQREELRLAIEQGRMMDQQVAEARMVQTLRWCRAVCLGAAAALPPRLIGKTAKTMRQMIEDHFARTFSQQPASMIKARTVDNSEADP